MKKRILVAIFILLVILFPSVYIYFTVISPSFLVKKPVIEKPALTQEINEQTIVYIANEIGSYKLHKDPISGEIPEIEFFIEDTKETYSILIIDNKPQVEKKEAIQPDIRMIGKEHIILQILNSENVEKEIVTNANEGKIRVEVLNDQKILALKGYKSIYDQLSKGNNSVTGQGISKINPMEITGISRMFFLLVLFLILELSFFYESL
ncbi:hypothetical protein GF327_07265 [Candidatus Woesearchaeota archaeon]|nr:hypothetical protein [Candidatus Woesearchaeota archaeon]